MGYAVSPILSQRSPAERKIDPIHAKIGDELTDLSAHYGLHRLLLGEDAEQSYQSPHDFIQVADGNVVVEIAAENNRAGQALWRDLEAHGFEPTADYGVVTSGYLPIENLPVVAEIDGLRFIRPVYKPIVSQGLISNQGNIALRADIAQTQFNVTGAGVTVGVLSDSFDNLGGAQADRQSGDLPDVNVLQDLPSGGSDEGRAMLQLIADIAPGADLAFHTAFLGQSGFAQGILNLANAGADIIVDDIIYLAEPFFQDGIVAQAVDQVVADGVAYFSAAGNNGNTAYESAFRNSGTELDFGTFKVEAHDFDPGSGVDIFQSVTIPSGSSINLSFQWASPYFSASGVQGATSDLDIFLLNQEDQVVASSVDNNINGDPVEILNFRNSDSAETEYKIVIGKFAGDTPSLIKYVGFGDLSIDEYATNSSTLFGQANAAGAQAVGAAFFKESPAFGEPSPQVESFSAIGGTPILYDRNGNLLSQPEVRLKPDIVATDGGNTTFFGRDIGSDADTFPNFFGTSAAAPNAAAVAALLLEAVPAATPADLYQALKTSALDLDNPNTAGFDFGFDAATGFGLIQADQALQTLLNKPLSPPNQPVRTVSQPTVVARDGTLAGTTELADLSLATVLLGEQPFARAGFGFADDDIAWRHGRELSAYNDVGLNQGIGQGLANHGLPLDHASLELFATGDIFAQMPLS